MLSEVFIGVACYCDHEGKIMDYNALNHLCRNHSGLGTHTECPPCLRTQNTPTLLLNRKRDRAPPPEYHIRTFTKVVNICNSTDDLRDICQLWVTRPKEEKNLQREHCTASFLNGFNDFPITSVIMQAIRLHTVSQAVDYCMNVINTNRESEQQTRIDPLHHRLKTTMKWYGPQAICKAENIQIEAFEEGESTQRFTYK